ncbi:hypothetical protein [Photobacterium ganghwense]|uniref:hypothetical protein n=1 Tax=Photobacterium ganghwense TaxID=320778 RepID=UPI001A8F764A|nr:hypothetical protein [Photobacterium ganghwense]QSV17679.1 hypothetical protein FH974_25545 [Photobacterium ganghwense]
MVASRTTFITPFVPTGAGHNAVDQLEKMVVLLEPTKAILHIINYGRRDENKFISGRRFIDKTQLYINVLVDGRVKNKFYMCHF